MAKPAIFLLKFYLSQHFLLFKRVKDTSQDSTQPTAEPSDNGRKGSVLDLWLD